MKQLTVIVLLLFTCLFCTSCQREDIPYLSIAVTHYNDQMSPENGMTTTILEKTSEGDLEEAGSVPYTSQYPLAVYDASEKIIYYSAVDETGKYDQLWKYNRDTRLAEKLTDSLFAINYIIPRQDDIFMIATERGERRNKPYLYNKATGELSEVVMDIDFNCSLCTYNPISDRLIMSGTSYSEEEEIREKWNARSVQSEPYYPPDTYVYELHENKADLLIQLERFMVRHLAVKCDDEIFYSGLVQKYADIPEKQYLFKTGETPVEYQLFKDKFPLTIYDEFVFTSENELYCIGAGEDSTKYPQGLYRYIISEDDLDLIYDGNIFDGYVNNFIFLK